MKTKMQKQEELAKEAGGRSQDTEICSLSSNELAIVEKKAAAKGMKPTSYIAHAAVHGCEGVTPATKIRVQNIINHAADALEEFAPEEAEQIRKEGNAIWDL